MFESILLFSLAVLIISVGMLVHYFKKRIVDIEQKNAKCFEIVQDVYMQQMQLKKEVFAVLFRQPEQQTHGGYKEEHSRQEQEEQENRIREDRIREDRIRVELTESDDEDESDDEESDDESDSDEEESNKKIKIVNVDLSYPEECDISIDESESEDDIVDEPEPEIVSLDHQETIVVNKVEETPKIVSKEELQKMSPATLKSLLISKGVPAESVNKLKKKELVDKLSEL